MSERDELTWHKNGTWPKLSSANVSNSGPMTGRPASFFNASKRFVGILLVRIGPVYGS
jgi:hypothetical protein